MIKRLSYLLVFILFTSQFLHTAAFRKVSGIVKERETGIPLPFVNIVVERTATGTSTKLDGTFILLLYGNDSTYQLSVSAVGYRTLSHTLVITGNTSETLELLLDSAPSETPEVVVTADIPFSGASSKQVSAIDFELRPKNSAQDMLRMAPGLTIAQHAGGGKAEQIFLRGFDADHGTDVNISVDGIPVNMVSHGHGQGYADLHFVLPEVLSGLEVYKGPYFAQFGDFGTAGTVKFTTVDAVERTSARVEVGSFGLKRIVGLANIPTGSENSSAYAAGEVLVSDSYFDKSQNFRRYNLFGKLISHFGEGATLTAWGSGFSSQWDASGQIPERAVQDGSIGRYGSIDPTEGGETSRENLNLIYKDVSSSSALLAQTYVSHYKFGLFSNFTFYKDDPVEGDEIEQTDERAIFGGRVEYSFNGTAPLKGTITTLGGSMRYDNIANGLWRAKERARLSTRADATIKETNWALYAQQEYALSEAIKLQLGIRADHFVFKVADHLNANKLDDISGNVEQTIVNPKINLMAAPSKQLELYANFGTGFHSNDARAVVSGASEATLPRSVGSELGMRFSPDFRFTLSSSLWLLDLERELVYSGDEGTTEESGSTRRMGIDIVMRAQLLSWLWADADITVSRGRFVDEPDDANFIPLAPTFTTTGGVSARLFESIESNIRYRHIGNRPANEMNTVTAKGYTVFDAGVSYQLNGYKLSLIIENIFDTEWNEAQFDTESRLLNEPDPVSELHFTPGTPFNIRAGIEIGL